LLDSLLQEIEASAKRWQVWSKLYQQMTAIVNLVSPQ